MLLQCSSSFGLYFHEAKTRKPKLHHIDTRFLIELLLDTEFESLSASKKTTKQTTTTATTTKTEILGIRCHSAVRFKSLKVFDFAYETNPKLARRNHETVNLPGQSNARSVGLRM